MSLYGVVTVRRLAFWFAAFAVDVTVKYVMVDLFSLCLVGMNMLLVG